MPVPGRRSLDPKQRGQLDAWASEVRARIDERRQSSGLDVKKLAKAVGVPRSTFLNWMLGEFPPDPWSLRRLAEQLSFPVPDQMALLGWALPTEGVAGAPIGSNSQLASMDARLRRAIGELEIASGLIVELSTEVAESSDRAGERGASTARRLADSILSHGAGRWESRLAPYRDGIRYPIVRETLIEFALSNGTEPLSWEELRTDYGSFIRERAPEMYEQNLDDDVIRDRIKRERLEVRAILDASGAEPDFDGNWLGEAGVRWSSVSRLAQQVEGQRWAHLFANSPPTPPPEFEQPTVLRNGTTSILLIAPTYQTARIVGQLVARALGWRHVAHGQVTTARWGRTRDGLGDERVRQLKKSFEEWVTAPSKGTVFSVIRADSVDEALAKQAVRAAGVLSVVVPPDRNVAEAWAAQQADNVEFTRTIVLGSIDRVLATSENLDRHFPSDHPSVVRLPFHLDEIIPASSILYRDPQISDEQVRIAERLRRILEVEPRRDSELHLFAASLADDPLMQTLARDDGI